LLKLKEKSKNENYPLLVACYHEDIEIAKLLIEYANDNNILLDLNEKTNKGNYHFY